MRETPDDLKQLEALLSSSIQQAGAFLRESFQMPEHSLAAAQLVQYLQGIQNVALATTTAQGAPRVAPIGSLFFRGRFCIPTVAAAVRTRHIARRPAVSLTHFAGDDLAIIVHGHAIALAADQPDFAALEQLQHETNGQSPRDWGEGVYLRIDADVFYTFARFPDQFPI